MRSWTYSGGQRDGVGLPTDVLDPVDSKFIVIVSVCLVVKRRRKNLLSVVGECLGGTVNGVCVGWGWGGVRWS